MKCTPLVKPNPSIGFMLQSTKLSDKLLQTPGFVVDIRCQEEAN